MPDIIAEKLHPDRITAARALYESLVCDLYPSPDPQNVFLKHWTEEQLATECLKPETALFTAPMPGLQVAGLLYGSNLEGGVGTIIWLGVDTACRGQSIGRTLLIAAEKFYAGFGAHKVKLFCNTVAARRFYERCGYEVEGYHPRHWWDMDCWSVGKIIADNQESE